MGFISSIFIRQDKYGIYSCPDYNRRNGPIENLALDNEQPFTQLVTPENLFWTVYIEKVSDHKLILFFPSLEMWKCFHYLE